MSDHAAHQPSLPDEPVLPAREPLDDLLDHIGDYAVLNGQLDGRHLRAYLALCGYAIMPVVPSGGVWICSYSDRSGHAVFATEVEALRHAVGCSMAVDFVTWGEF